MWMRKIGEYIHDESGDVLDYYICCTDLGKEAGNLRRSIIELVVEGQSLS